jgi:hypothetical protein
MPPKYQHDLGEQHISDAMTFPRIVWVVRGGRIMPASLPLFEFPDG